ncbi:metal-dependent phosphohydrolase, HD subdomain protein [Virgisporangium aliadipatigenens]|uniref:Metal-dependent phosphohydrolase, HD subdomain protein n=1 Tax=Virgisporangium aliadipatigenens TaxID=741659 RepID=A0A8J3YZ20_9ACTN|nr:HD domain-containing protein [Virgisporangium aliadipatigenens]GIJ52341.1 metal-dependent phosphohydrolase, HD subdomain protein [Virgisporangium aliadipatigenens]
MRESIVWARELAERLMAAELPRRWGHVQAVAAKAEGLRPAVGGEADLLVMAAWLHDIGYSSQIKVTGFHPLDGARYLSRLGANPRLCGLVGNHSGAAVEASLRGLTDEMAAFPDEATLVRDAVWYCDMTTSPVGEPVTFAARLAEIKQRYGLEHTVPCAIEASAPEIRGANARVLNAEVTCAGYGNDVRSASTETPS